MVNAMRLVKGLEPAERGETVSDQDKTKAVDLAVAQVERAYGKGAIMRIGDGVIERVPVVSSGDIGLDIALGVGGYPTGRVVEIFGPESSGRHGRPELGRRDR